MQKKILYLLLPVLLCTHTLSAQNTARKFTDMVQEAENYYRQKGKIGEIEKYEKSYERVLRKGEKEEPPPKKGARGRAKRTKGRNLLERLKKHQEAVLRFAKEENVPFTNNQAERDIRCLKTKQKVATSFRTFAGAQYYARIQSFVSTSRKHRMNVFQNLINIFNKKAVVFETA